MAVLDRFKLLSQGQQPVAEQTGMVGGQQTLPQIDTSDAIGSLAEMLGPTPAEREARQRQLEQSRSKMAMWTGLFDGLRQLGNLYYASKGATPQQFGNPYAQVESMYQDAAKRADDLDTYRRQYAQQLYSLRRQAGEDRRKDLLATAQANYYDTRDEVARMKAENDRLKNEKYIELQDGRIAKLNAETGKIEELTPLQAEEIRSRTAKNNRTGGGGSRTGGGMPYKEHYIEEVVDPATGKKIKKFVAGRYGQDNNPKQPNKTVQKEPQQKKVIKW